MEPFINFSLPLELQSSFLKTRALAATVMTENGDMRSSNTYTLERF